MLYRLKNLVKRYENRNVLDLIELGIERGRIYGLVGPNGAGKTTLLEILAFIMKADGGELFFNKNKVDYNNSALLKLRSRVVLLQQHPIMFTASVYKNVEFPLKVRKIDKSERRAIVDELLSMVGMTAFEKSPGHTLSGGETQRVAIARALACSPDVILLDEPTSSVDIENRTGIENIIKRINKEKGISIIFTSHDMLQVSRMADKIIFLNNGRISDSIHENIFNGVITGEKKEKHIMIREGFNIPLDTSLNGHVRISIDPLKVKLHRNINSVSDENIRLKGKLIQLTCEGERVRILVDMDVPLSLLMEKEEYAISELDIGDTVFIEFPEDSIQFI